MPSPYSAILAPPANVTTLGEIVVTGTPQAMELNRMPADVTVIHEEQLRQPGINGYQDALRREVPGVKISPRQEGDIATPGLEVRGLDSNPTSGGNVLILLDGVPQRRLSFGGPYAGGLPFNAVNRIGIGQRPDRLALRPGRIVRSAANVYQPRHR